MSRDDDFNPFQSPLAVEPVLHVEGDAELTRRKYLSHEASIRSIGLLWLVGGVISAIYTAVFVVALLTGGFGDPDFSEVFGSSAAILVGLTLAFGLLTFVGIASGLGLRRLDGKWRIVAILFAIPGLLGIPVGTLISGYIIWLLASERGRYVMSPAYAEVRAQTPHIKYKTSIIVKVFVALLLAVIAMAVMAVVIGMAAG